MDRLDEVVSASSRAPSGSGPATSQLMMLTRDQETGESMSNEQLRNQIMTLMLAGYETTASALTWTW
jgi:pentalenene oxygenase